MPQIDIELRQLLKDLVVPNMGIAMAYDSTGVTSNEVVDEIMKHVTTHTNKARINELTRLDNAYDEVTPDNFHEYYIERLKELRGEDATAG